MSLDYHGVKPLSMLLVYIKKTIPTFLVGIAYSLIKTLYL